MMHATQSDQLLLFVCVSHVYVQLTMCRAVAFLLVFQSGFATQMQ